MTKFLKIAAFVSTLIGAGGFSVLATAAVDIQHWQSASGAACFRREPQPAHRRCAGRFRGRFGS